MAGINKLAQMGNTLPQAKVSPLQGCKRHLIAAFACSSLIALLFFAPTIYMMQVYDRVLSTGGVMTLVFLSVALIVAILTLSLLESTRTRLMARAALRADRRISQTLMRASFEAGARADPRAKQVMREFDQFRAFIASPAATALMDAFFAPLFLFACFLIHWWIGVFVICGSLVLVITGMINQHMVRKSVEQHNAQAPTMYALQEADQSSGDIAMSMGMISALTRRHSDMRRTLNDGQTQSALSSSSLAATSRFFRLTFQSGALGLAALLAINNQITPGAMIAASVLAGRTFGPAEMIVTQWRQIAGAQNGYRTLKGLLGHLANHVDRMQLPAPTGELLLDKVSARTPDQKNFAIYNLSFGLRPGTVLGVIGPSGAGKTTLARLLAGARRPESGELRLDGSNMADWDSEELGPFIGYLPQEVALFAGTIAENISRFAELRGFDREKIGDQVVAAARMAGAHAMIQRLPEGYDTVLGPNGSGLSAGQSQRVALARALFANPRLIILDEPNAHLDMEGQVALISAIRKIKATGATVILITHRGGVLDVVDRLLVLRSGRLDLLGPRDKVMAELEKRQALQRAGGPDLKVERGAQDTDESSPEKTITDAPILTKSNRS